MAAGGSHPKIARDLEGLGSEESANVIVQYRETPSREHLNRARQRGAVHQQSLEVVKGAAFRMSGRTVAELADDPDVVMISPDRPVTATLDRANSSANYNQLSDYLNSMHLAKGGGIGIAILDSGIDTGHRNFKGYNPTVSRIVYDQSYVPNETFVGDLYGHGTHVAGIAAGLTTSHR